MTDYTRYLWNFGDAPTKTKSHDDMVNVERAQCAVRLLHDDFVLPVVLQSDALRRRVCPDVQLHRFCVVLEPVGELLCGGVNRP